MRLGKSREMAINIGFSRAWLSIRDSNIASLITSAVLYYFGTGIVRGFAFTLALGVMVSMFSAIFVTRTLLKVFYKK
jgi:preprotein translocase subunit SecD